MPPPVQSLRLVLPQGEVNYLLERRPRRRGVAILVDPARGIVVRAPLSLGRRAIEEALASRASWLLKQQAWLKEQGLPRPARLFAGGEALLLAGQAYQLRLGGTEQGPLWSPRLEQGGILLAVPPGLEPGQQTEQVRRALQRWYLRLAARDLPGRVAGFAQALGLAPPVVLVRDQKSRWGSCAADGRIRLNWRLVMAPPELADYVAAHEACHLLARGHSPRFWGLVAGLLPDYAARRASLRRQGHLYTL